MLQGGKACSDGAPLVEDSALAPALPTRHGSCKRRDDLQQRLKQTTAQLQKLDRRIESLRGELRACEGDRRSLAQMEVWLSREVAGMEPLDTPALEQYVLTDDVSTYPAYAGPAVCEVDAETKDQCHISTSDPSSFINEGDQSLDSFMCEAPQEEEDPDMEDWEASLDAIGVAKCRLCGLRLPLDPELIDQHARGCCGDQRDSRFASSQQVPGRSRSKTSIVSASSSDSRRISTGGLAGVDGRRSSRRWSLPNFTSWGKAHRKEKTTIRQP